MEETLKNPEINTPSKPLSNAHEEEETTSEESKPLFDQNEIFKALEIVEKDSMAIAETYVSLFSSLRLILSEVTSSSVDHMRCFSDAAGRVQESWVFRLPTIALVTVMFYFAYLCLIFASIFSFAALDAATKGNRYINSCLRLNEELKSIDSLALQLYPFKSIFSLLTNLHTY
ncbi:hypothetical protein MKW92_044585 [Papaver armeniacum]|nr:hypothetical protein MKW92_044585 [Papaver armeniacum]